MKKLLAVLILLLVVQGVSFADTQTNTAEYYIRQIQAENVSYNNYGFFKSIKEGNLDLVDKFLKAGMDANSSLLGFSALDVAIKENHIEVVRALLDNGARINPLATRTTPLLTAIQYKNPAIVSTLIAFGANVNQSVNNKTPLNYAIKQGNSEVVSKLINAGAATNEEVLLNGLKSKNANIKNMVLIQYKSTP